jgi:GrpB-like predicted nucleotidyltransferase (UPF0157 family)
MKEDNASSKSEFVGIDPGPEWPKLKLVIAEYDPRWPAVFAEERALIVSAAADLLVEVHHFGSTAVPNLCAKPIIDIIGECARAPDADDVARLRAVGYVHRRRTAKANLVFLAKGEHDFHLQLLVSGDPDIARCLGLRDYLRAHPADATLYGDVKQSLVRKYGDNIKEYGREKCDELEAFHERALRWRPW